MKRYEPPVTSVVDRSNGTTGVPALVNDTKAVPPVASPAAMSSPPSTKEYGAGTRRVTGSRK